MNNNRRKRIAEIEEKLEALKLEVEGIIDEEQEYIECMPENLQGGEKYERGEEAISSMDSAMSSIEEAIDYLSESKE